MFRPSGNVVLFDRVKPRVQVVDGLSQCGGVVAGERMNASRPAVAVHDDHLQARLLDNGPDEDEWPESVQRKQAQPAGDMNRVQVGMVSLFRQAIGNVVNPDERVHQYDNHHNQDAEGEITKDHEVGPLEEWSLDAQEQDEQKGYLRDFFTNYFDVGSARFEDLVSNGGVKAVYMGHIHAFWAADHRGVRYVISGGGGSPLYPLPPGYPKVRFAHTMRVEAGPNGLRETVLPMNGAPFVLPPVRP